MNDENIRKEVKYVRLIGGLGNQLFQLANALSYSPSLELITTMDSSTSNQEIDKLILPKVVQLKKGEVIPKPLSRLLNLGVRLSTRKYWFFPIFRPAIEIISSIAISISFGRVVRVLIAHGLGSTSRKKRRNSNVSLDLGYFQSYEVIQNFERKYGAQIFKLKEIKPELQDLILRAKSEKPIVVQIRLGDYLQEREFGLLPPEYFENSINALLAVNKSENIWVFSNDPGLAMKFLNRKYHVRVIDDKLLSAAETLELMRYGSGYVISNSTFGWWGAFLRYDKSAKVFTPTPWFKGLPDPQGLVPTDWYRSETWK